MPVTVFRSNLAYVKAMHSVDTGFAGQTTRSAASFLSSIYFPQSSLARYFTVHASGHEIVELLLERKRVVIERAAHNPRREIYEASALQHLILQGRPHDQNKSYFLTPREITATLRALLQVLVSEAPIEVAVTRQVLPLVFLLKAENILIDIGPNYSYQGIQGLLISGESHASDQMRSEFENIWSSPDTISNQMEVRRLVELSLQDWETTGALATDRWPNMRLS
jgi:hypothetical protein